MITTNQSIADTEVAKEQQAIFRLLSRTLKLEHFSDVEIVVQEATLWSVYELLFKPHVPPTSKRNLITYLKAIEQWHLAQWQHRMSQWKQQNAVTCSDSRFPGASRCQHLSSSTLGTCPSLQG